MPHLLVAAAHKSSGKTTVTLGLCAALARRGMTVQPFKKGPDYIDPMWLSRAAGRACHNLDFQVMSDAEIRATFARHAADISIVEGNMGLFDSVDVEGEYSNAAMAALLQAPVILVVNVQGMTRSVAPLVLGFLQFDPSIRIAGVILNNVAGRRHEERLRQVFERYIDVPLLGCIHRDAELAISERHLGLIPSNEAGEVEQKLDYIATSVGGQLDLERIVTIAQSATPVTVATTAADEAPPDSPSVRIGIARDAAFGFYYAGDLKQLRQAGAELVEFDTLRDSHLPAVDGLFIGGGFPETHLDALEANSAMRHEIRAAIEAGMPAYAECGGLMYLARSIRWDDRCRDMVGVIPGDVVMYDRPQGRGYVRLRELDNHPWPREQVPREFSAHEFHYSTVENLPPGLTFAYEMVRGTGVDGRHDGIVYKNLVANYVHLRDVEGYRWARRFVDFVRERRAQAGAA